MITHKKLAKELAELARDLKGQRSLDEILDDLIRLGMDLDELFSAEEGPDE